MRPARKITRFYIINPIGDRRTEIRFQSTENVVIKFLDNDKVTPAMAHEVGQAGLRLESECELEVGQDIEVSFPKAPDHINCFGRIVWVKFHPGANMWTCGVAVESWHGIVAGSNSWMVYKGSAPQKDRRHTPR